MKEVRWWWYGEEGHEENGEEMERTKRPYASGGRDG